MLIIDPKSTVAPHVTSRLAERVGLRYLYSLLLIPAVAFILPFIVERVPQAWSRVGSYNAEVLEYNYHVGRRDADVVLFGDSSVLYGIDPARLSAELHLKAINVPSIYGSLPVLSDTPLRRYLQTNRPPRLIVFFVAPWNLDAGNDQKATMYEAEEILLRHEGWRQVLRFGRLHPAELLQFPFRFYAVGGGPERVFRHPSLPRMRMDRGCLPYEYGGPTSDMPRTRLAEGCAFPNTVLANKNSTYFAGLVKQYASGGTRTMVYLAPLPGCAHAAEFTDRSYAAVGAAAPRILPASDFADDLQYVHVLPEFTSLGTDALAAAIRHKLSAP